MNYLTCQDYLLELLLESCIILSTYFFHPFHMAQANITSSAHTAGPWRIHENAVSIDIVDMAHSHGIAIIEKRGVNDEQKMANAHLIAAAPELLDELNLIVDAWLKRGTHGTNRLTIWEKERLHYMKEAIAKAEGK